MPGSRAGSGQISLDFMAARGSYLRVTVVKTVRLDILKLCLRSEASVEYLGQLKHSSRGDRWIGNIAGRLS